MTYPTIVEVFERSVAQYGPKVVLKLPKPGLNIEDVAEYEEISFSDLQRLSDQCATALRRLGVKPGDKVALLSRPRREWAGCMLGVLKLGAIVVPIDPHLTPAEVKRILQETDALVAIAAEDHIEHVQGASPLRHIISMGTPPAPSVLGLRDLLRQAKDKPAVHPIPPSDLAFIICTSGTTGNSKGVMLAHENLTSNLTGIFARLDVNDRDVVLTIAPWNHIFGLIVLHAALWQGAKLVYTDDYKNLADLIKDNQTTILAAVPKLYHAMFSKIEDAIKAKLLSRLLHRLAPRLVGWRLRRKLTGGKLRFFVSGSAPLDPAVEQGFRRLGIGLIEGYGMTETAPALTFSTPFNDKYGSVGPALPNVEIRISEPNEDGLGEVVVRGPNVMRGYYRNPERTRQVLEPDGWLHTGDLGVLDVDGWLYLKGRKKNVIVLDTGKNVYPEEIEWELGRSPYIEDILIQGSNRKRTEVIKAFVYPRWERFGDLAADRHHVKRVIWDEIKTRQMNLAPYKRIRSEQDVILLEQPFAKTSTLDIKRYLYQDAEIV